MIDQMPDRMKKLGVVLVTVMCLCAGASAQDDEHVADGRLHGYQDSGAGGARTIELKPTGHASTWFILAGLGLLGLGVMFKNARRTHLD